jgi:hypothetical protein
VNTNGQRVLVTRQVARRGDRELSGFSFTLSGIPTPGAGRWVAVACAVALMLAGFGAFRGAFGARSQRELETKDRARARRVLLDELVALTRAREQAQIGPSTYESARRTLVEALARITSGADELAAPRRASLAKEPEPARAKGSKRARAKALPRPSEPPSTA